MEGSFEAFFRRAEPLVRRALVAGYGPELGREAAAEALSYGWRNWERVRTMENSTGYLYRVGEGWARRQQRRRPVGFPPVEIIDAGYEPGLGPALNSLTARQRQAVVLVAGFGLSHAEAATLLGLRRSSVQNHVERGMTKLRIALGVET